MSKKKIFLSYSWANKDIADELDKDFLYIGVVLTRDVRDAPIFESLSGFMSTIKVHDFVFPILSDQYLKSINCLNEIVEFSRVKDYKHKMIPIILDNAKRIWDFSGQVHYIDYWQNKLQNATKIINRVDPLNACEQVKQVEKIRTICQHIGGFLSIVGDKKTMGFDVLQETQYNPILKFIGIKNVRAKEDIVRISKIEDDEEQEIEMMKHYQKYGESDIYFAAKGYQTKKRYKVRKYCYEKALEINPKYLSVHFNYANLLETDLYHDFEESRKHYEIALDLNPNFTPAHNNLALLLASSAFMEYDEAKKHFEIILKNQPNDARYHNNYANLLGSSPYNDYELALEHHKKAIEIDPEYSLAHKDLADFYLLGEFKDYDSAKYHYEKAIEYNSNFYEAHDCLSDLLDNVYGDKDNASLHYQIALWLKPNECEDI